MVQQTEIIFATPAAAPAASIDDVEWLVTLLDGKGWKTAAQLEELSGGLKNDRKIRAIGRAAAPVIVSYPGSPGYKLWAECTVDEIHHCLNAWESQIRDNTVRRAIYERAYHTKFRGTTS
jgi:hypothetical protein